MGYQERMGEWERKAGMNRGTPKGNRNLTNKGTGSCEPDKKSYKTGIATAILGGIVATALFLKP